MKLIRETRNRSRTSTWLGLAIGLVCLIGSNALAAADPSASGPDEVKSPTSASYAAASDAHTSGPADYSAERDATRRGVERHESDWEYDPDYLFALTRNMPDSGLPRVGQVLLYPLGFAIDLAQWPVGALAGLAGK